MLDEHGFISELTRVFKANKLPSLTMEKCERFLALTKRMLEENEKYNLTAITDPDKIILNHYADCAALAAILPKGAKVADVGCGAGFPTLPIAILREDVEITAIDSTAKRVAYVEESARLLGLTNVKAVTMRAEEGGTNPIYREKFDIATARAVATMRILAELCLPYVKVGGEFIAMKGKNATEELSASKNAIKLLGGKIFATNDIRLTDGEEEFIHPLIVIDKKAPTTKTYPRAYAQILKKPL